MMLCAHDLFCFSPDLSGKIHQCAQGEISSHISQKGAIVQKRLKSPGLKYSAPKLTFKLM